ncbi:MAG: DUF488 domain-containing protein [Jatrophihabitantaceae bacterium]
MSTLVHTVGHANLPAARLAELLDGVGVRRVVDVRSFPGSRRNPHFGSAELAGWLPGYDLGYTWLRDLGGRRRARPDSPHTSLRHPAFRGYADHMDGAQFRAAVDELLVLASAEPLTVMCSESLWWRCHRRLLADYLQLVRGVDVRHVMPDGRVTPHPPTDGVRVAGDRLIYDAPVRG